MLRWAVAPHRGAPPPGATANNITTLSHDVAHDDVSLNTRTIRIDCLGGAPAQILADHERGHGNASVRAYARKAHQLMGSIRNPFQRWMHIETFRNTTHPQKVAASNRRPKLVMLNNRQISTKLGMGGLWRQASWLGMSPAYWREAYTKYKLQGAAAVQQTRCTSHSDMPDKLMRCSTAVCKRNSPSRVKAGGLMPTPLASKPVPTNCPVRYHATQELQQCCIPCY